MDYQEQEHVIQILMGLNDSYSGTRGKILMLDPLPSVAKVFNLVVQEEQQCTIGYISTAPGDSLAFNVPSSQPPFLPTPNAPVAAVSSSQSQPRRECPICSRCGLTGPYVDRCYKLHGFPPGYKPKLKAQAHQSFIQSTSETSCLTTSASTATIATTFSLPFDQLSTDPVQQLIAYLSSQL